MTQMMDRNSIPLHRHTVPSPVGPLILSQGVNGLQSLDWGDDSFDTETDVLAEAKRQLEAYFRGELKTFELPFAPMGTPFQQKVWRRLRQIPYGDTVSYGELAAKLGTGPRAVARACATNPLAIFIPCHRVVAASGSLTGYSGGQGVHTKRALLRLEGAMPPS
ncbi:MAG: methylated-DNA--[protein]-cysteine S-methyltransferase [Alphaproteobacteria bacterium]